MHVRYIFVLHLHYSKLAYYSIQIRIPQRTYAYSYFISRWKYIRVQYSYSIIIKSIAFGSPGEASLPSITLKTWCFIDCYSNERDSTIWERVVGNPTPPLSSPEGGQWMGAGGRVRTCMSCLWSSAKPFSSWKSPPTPHVEVCPAAICPPPPVCAPPIVVVPPWTTIGEKANITRGRRTEVKVSEVSDWRDRSHIAARQTSAIPLWWRWWSRWWWRRWLEWPPEVRVRWWRWWRCRWRRLRRRGSPKSSTRSSIGARPATASRPAAPRADSECRPARRPAGSDCTATSPAPRRGASLLTSNARAPRYEYVTCVS